ncbi:MAG: PEP-CTERM sorting domain-containing protein [Akkermansia muciniphila]|nr:PEP-CTERM sorting domain-containing protein [Akkermansia muciniphila]
MKKTFFTLCALTGLAAADTKEFTNDEFNIWYGSSITLTNYKVGDDYTLTFTMGEWPAGVGDLGYQSGIFLNMTENWGLFTQAGQYLAFDDSSTSDRSNLTTSQGTYTSSNTSTATGSLAQGTEGWFYTWNNGTNQQVDTVITLSHSNGVDTVLISKGSTTIANFTITGTSAMDASIFKMNDISGTNGFNVKTAAFSANGVDTTLVPEPATATLSLLALAGLAVRRRRKQA